MTVTQGVFGYGALKMNPASESFLPKQQSCQRACQLVAVHEPRGPGFGANFSAGRLRSMPNSFPALLT
jgi:hypothetical protein